MCVYGAQEGCLLFCYNKTNPSNIYCRFHQGRQIGSKDNVRACGFVPWNNSHLEGLQYSSDDKYCTVLAVTGAHKYHCAHSKQNKEFFKLNVTLNFQSKHFRVNAVVCPLVCEWKISSLRLQETQLTSVRSTSRNLHEKVKGDRINFSSSINSKISTHN